ncbi:MAG: D-alanine--D-alanine ligase [Herbinix sp.]|nr:D-alanine--D-alanine ligase [Herbinix sp.]
MEHEVSIISAIQATYSFNKEKYEIIPVYITKENRMFVGEEIGKIEAYKNVKGLLKNSKEIILINENNRLNLVYYPIKKFGNAVYDSIDVAFPIVHGTNVEDGTFQGYLKHLGIPFVGCDVLASAVGMDKYVMKTILKESGIPVLDCCYFDQKRYQKDSDTIMDEIEAKLGYPVIVKPSNLGSSVGIKVARDRDSLSEALEYAFQYAKKVLVEHAITALREINCSVIGDYEEALASECEEPITTDEILSYEDKYLSGGKGNGSKGMSSTKRQLPAQITKEQRDTIRDLAVRTFQALDCNGVARIDLMIDKDTGKIWVNEINTIPGSLAFYLWEALGMKYIELLDRCVSLALKRDRENKEIVYSFDTNILSGVSFGGMKGLKG